MERYIHNENIQLYRRLISESQHDPTRDEDHQMLLTVLAEETEKNKKASR